MSCISCPFYCILFIDEVFHRFCLPSYLYESQIKFQPNNFLIIYVTITITYRLFLVTKKLIQSYDKKSREAAGLVFYI